MNKKEVKTKTKAIRKACATNPQSKRTSRVLITNMITRIMEELDKNMDRLVSDMDVHTALETIERLQELRDMESYHDLKFGK